MSQHGQYNKRFTNYNLLFSNGTQFLNNISNVHTHYIIGCDYGRLLDIKVKKLTQEPSLKSQRSAMLHVFLSLPSTLKVAECQQVFDQWFARELSGDQFAECMIHQTPKYLPPRVPWSGPVSQVFYIIKKKKLKLIKIWYSVSFARILCLQNYDRNGGNADKGSVNGEWFTISRTHHVEEEALSFPHLLSSPINQALFMSGMVRQFPSHRYVE